MIYSSEWGCSAIPMQSRPMHKVVARFEGLKQAVRRRHNSSSPNKIQIKFALQRPKLVWMILKKYVFLDLFHTGAENSLWRIWQTMMLCNCLHSFLLKHNTNTLTVHLRSGWKARQIPILALYKIKKHTSQGIWWIFPDTTWIVLLFIEGNILGGDGRYGMPSTDNQQLILGQLCTLPIHTPSASSCTLLLEAYYPSLLRHIYFCRLLL